MRVSQLARPPIQPHECENVETAICVNHNGLIRFTGDTEGRVFYCPQGREYWRYSKTVIGMNAPLRYQHERAI